MHMSQYRKPAVHRLQVQLDVSFYRDWDERTYDMMLDNLICDRNDDRATRPSTLSYCLLDVSLDRLPFLNSSRIWREAVKYETKYRVGDVDGYYVRWHNREFFIISPEERPKLYVRVSDWRKK